MKTILELLHSLKTPGATEFAVVTGRFPCVKVGGKYEAVEEHATTNAAILKMIEALDGRAHLSSIGAQPAQWAATLDGVGAVHVMAARRGDAVQLRVVPTGPPPKKHSLRMARRSLAPQAAKPSLHAPAAHKPRRSSLRPHRKKSSDAISLAPPSIDETLEAVVVPPQRSVNIATHEHSARDVASNSSAELDALLLRARRRGASDLHVVAGRPALHRLVGQLVSEGAPLEASTVERVLLAVVPPRLREPLQRDGAVDFALAHPEHGRFRVNVSRQRTGYKGSFRLIPREVPTLEALALPPEIGEATKHHQGLIVVTGPTGHGKTTTLAAIVDRINAGTTHHVITVEDPVEHLHPRKRAMISQREVGTHTKSFAAALKASLREDPDVIVVGELRDTETVRMALSASETGHLVVGTMNTPSAAKTIDRLIDLFPPADQQQVRMTLAGGLRLVVSQRLLPNAAGNGLVAACEVLPGSIALWNLIRDGKTFQIPSLQQRGRAAGIVRLDDSLAELVRAGRTSIESALDFAEDPDELRAKIAPRAAHPAGSQDQKPSQSLREGGFFARAGSLLGKR